MLGVMTIGEQLVRPTLNYTKLFNLMPRMETIRQGHPDRMIRYFITCTLSLLFLMIVLYNQ